MSGVAWSTDAEIMTFVNASLLNFDGVVQKQWVCPCIRLNHQLSVHVQFHRCEQNRKYEDGKCPCGKGDMCLKKCMSPTCRHVSVGDGQTFSQRGSVQHENFLNNRILYYSDSELAMYSL